MASSPNLDLDPSLRLETIYYSAQIPRNLAVLNVLGVVFDRVHFPGVYIPTEGFDRKALAKEIDRIEALDGPKRDNNLTSMLRFTLLAPILEGMCVFDDEATVFDDKLIPKDMPGIMYEAIHGPNPPNWFPSIETSWHKAMPDSEVSLSYRGTYHYLCGAILQSERTGIPLLNDIDGLPVPAVAGGGQQAPNADTLAAMIAIQSVLVALPELPLLSPHDLMEFRAENQESLRTFRRSMLRYAAEFRDKAKNASPKEIEAELNFFAKTTIVPALDELRHTMERPARPLHQRAGDVLKIGAQLAAGIFAAKEGNVALAALSAYAPQVISELVSKGDKNEALKRHGLHYLLKLEAKRRG